MRGNLYQVVGPVPDGFILSPEQKDIMDNWSGGNNLFSISQIAERNRSSRRRTKRKIDRLIKMNVVKLWYSAKQHAERKHND